MDAKQKHIKLAWMLDIQHCLLIRAVFAFGMEIQLQCEFLHHGYRSCLFPLKPLPLSHSFNHTVSNGSRNKPTWAQLSGFLGFLTFFWKILIETSRTSPEDDATIANQNKIPQESCSGNSLIFIPENRAFLKYFSTSNMTSQLKYSLKEGVWSCFCLTCLKARISRYSIGVNRDDNWMSNQRAVFNRKHIRREERIWTDVLRI